MKNYSASLSIRKIQIKTIFRFHLTTVRVAKINHNLTAHFDNDVEQGEHSYTTGGNTNLCRHYENQFVSSTERRNLSASRSNYTTLGMIPKETSILPLLFGFIIIDRNKKKIIGLSAGDQKIICDSEF